MQTKLIIFDCDGVLVDSERISCRIFTQLMREEGIEISEEQVYQDLVGGSMQKSIAYVESILGYKLSESNFTEKYRTRSFEAYKNELTTVPGVESLITSLRIPYCVGSNGPREKINWNLKLTGLDKYFPQANVFSAYDLKKWKPDPTLFLHAASQMGVHPENALVIEDSRNGILAANAAGIPAIAYSPVPVPDRFEGLDCTMISDMKKVIKQLK